jgi:2-keto-4-pentenoate hydratase
MPAPFDVDALALEMKTAQDAVRQIEPFTSRLTTFDLATAYEVQHWIHRARIAEGARPVGRKIGFTNPDMWARYHVKEPIWAHVYDTTVVQLQGTQAACSLGRFAEPKIEPEIVLHFRKALPAGTGLAGVLDAVDWVAHGFEIVQSHFPGWKFRAPDTVADGSLHGRLFVGPPQPMASLGDDPMATLAAFSLSLSCDGRPIATGVGANVLGSPLAAIAHLVSVLARQPHGQPLQAGEIVTTGTITTAQSVRPGEVWRSEIQGAALPGLEIAFAA